MRCKKILVLALALVMAGSLIAQAREYTPFADIPEDSWCYQEVKLCYEKGLVNGKTEELFAPQDSLSIAQLVVMAARLYNIQKGGDGVIPDLPDLSKDKDYLRFYDESGNIIRSYKFGETLSGTYERVDEPAGPYLMLSDQSDDESLPKKCTLEIGFEDYGEIVKLDGVWETYHPPGGVMTHGLDGTGYRFAEPEGYSLSNAMLFLDKTEIERFKDAWWFPSVFYLCYENRIGFQGELIFRADPNHNADIDGEKYDPITGFNEPASRNLFAWLLDRAAGNLEEKHSEAEISVPDVDPEEDRDAEAILRLYREGILSGVDSTGRFNGTGTLNRGQAAAMMARVLNPDLRK